MKILHVIPSLEYSSAAMQLGLLSQWLPRDKLDARVCVLGREGPCLTPLRAAALPVECLGWTRRFDPTPPWQLRRIVRQFCPDIIHTWGRTALRFAALARSKGSKIVVSHALTRPGCLSRLDRLLLKRADAVVAGGNAEAARHQAIGAPERTITIPPAVLEKRPWAVEEPSASWRRPYVLCTGPLEPHKGFRDAIWGFDILRYVYPDLSLVLVGNGSDRSRLEFFTRLIRAQEYVHFAGDRGDVPRLLEGAELVWVPSRAEAGITFALEAMSAGCPVIASRFHGLAEVIADGTTGFLVPPGDKVAVARQTRLLLSQPKRRQEMGALGRQHVRKNFPVADLVRRFTALYDNLAA